MYTDYSPADLFAGTDRMTAPSARRSVHYLRLSQSDDASTSIDRQRADLVELAEREGWAIVAELVDDGVSGRKTRANAAEALRMLRDGEADVLVVWKLDRWSRQGIAALGDLVDALDARPSALFVAHRDGLRSDQAAWRIIAAVLAEVARIEAENTSTRVKSSQAHLLRERRFRGYTVPFGYRSVANPDGPGRVLVHDEVEAPLVRELVARLLGGASLTELTNYLNDARVPAPKSAARKARQTDKPTEGLSTGTWYLPALRSLLVSETLMGRTTHAVPVLDSDGEPVLDDGKPRTERRPVTDERGLPITFWPPVIDAATMSLVRDRLPVAAGKLSSRRRAARVLSGVAYCGVCDSKLYVVNYGDLKVYRCAAKRRDIHPPCPSPQIPTTTLEDYVEARLLAVVGAAPEVEEVRVVDNPEAAADLAAIDSALQEATAALMRDGVDAAAVFNRINSLKARRAELRDRPAAVHTAYVPTGRTWADAWHAADPSTPDGVRARRAIVLYALDHVRLLPGGRGGGQVPAADRVELMWADHAVTVVVS